MIANPYKKTKRPNQARQKRVERPWESRTPSVATSGDSEPPALVLQQSNAPASSIPPALLTLPASLPASNAPRETREVDPFDCGIDWTAAVQSLDAHSSTQITTTTTIKSSSAPASHLQENSHRQNLNDVSHANTKPPEKPPGLLKLPPKKPVAKELLKDVNALSNLRPASWTHASASKPPAKEPLSRSNSTTDSLDPDQRTLPPELRFKPKDVAPVVDEHQAQLVKHADIGAPLLNNWTLYSHQKHAILRALRLRRCILALDMGLGKTLIGCVWAKAFIKTMQLHVVVICPVSLQEEWKRSMEQATGLTVQDLAGTSKKNRAKSSSESANAASVSVHSWSKIPSDIEENYGDYVVIADEAHSMQSMQAARTKETLKLMSGTLCEGVLLLTGTPMKNGKPSNLFPLLRAVQHPLGRHQKAYEAHFCAGHEVNFGRGRVWQATGASNLDQLRKLSKTHMLHLTKETCLKDLPPLDRVFVKVPVSSRRVMQHTQALQELARIYNARGSGAVQNDAILGAVQKLRMVGSLAKVEATVEQAKGILQDEAAVVVFTSFQQVAKNVYHQLREAGWEGELLTGETPAKKRQSMVDRFQQGISPVFCCTFGAGGVGLTLTAAHTVIFCDRPWTPGDALQAEDRVRRIGQTKPVKSLWIRAFDIDEQIDEMIEQKKQTSAAVLMDGDGSTAERQSAPRLSIFQMLKSILPANQGLTQTSILQFSQEG